MIRKFGLIDFNQDFEIEVCLGPQMKWFHMSSTSEFSFASEKGACFRLDYHKRRNDLNKSKVSFRISGIFFRIKFILNKINITNQCIVILTFEKFLK